MTKKSPNEKKSSENSPINSSKVKDKTCIQPAVLAIRTAAMLERPPTPTPGASPSAHGTCRAEPFLAPIYIPNKILASQKGSRQITLPQRHSTTRIREINVLSKAGQADTYRNGKVEMAGSGFPSVDNSSVPKISNEVKTAKRASFLPKIEQATLQTLTNSQRSSFHAITHHEYQLYGFKRSPLGRLEGNSISSEVRLPATKSKHHRNHGHKKANKSDARRTDSSSFSPQSPVQELENLEHTPKPPSLPKNLHEAGQKRPRRNPKLKKLETDNSPTNSAPEDS